jgi:hypothetical protein
MNDLRLGCGSVVEHLPKYYGLSLFSKCLCTEMWDKSSQKEGMALKIGLFWLYSSSLLDSGSSNIEHKSPYKHIEEVTSLPQNGKFIVIRVLIFEKSMTVTENRKRLFSGGGYCDYHYFISTHKWS